MSKRTVPFGGTFHCAHEKTGCATSDNGGRTIARALRACEPGADHFTLSGRRLCIRRHSNTTQRSIVSARFSV